MSARLLDRIARLVRADAHGVVEALEERSLLLKQCVREAELELDRKRARLESLRQEEKHLGDDLARCESEIRGLDADVALALEGGKDDLARFAIRRLLRRRTMAEAVRERLQQVGAEAAALDERVAAQAVQFESLRLRVGSELARAARDGTPVAPPCPTDVADEEVEIELLRRRGSGGESR